MVNKHPINFYIFYEIDEQEAEHAESLKNYHKEGTGTADYQHWALLEEVNVWAKKLSLVSRFFQNGSEQNSTA